MWLRLICIKFLFFAPLVLSAQEIISEVQPEIPLKTCKVSIKVLEKGTRSKLQDINVFLLPDGIKAVTSAEAIATFEDIACDQSHQWVINVAGYQRQDLRQTITQDQSFTVYIEKIDQNAFQTQVLDERAKRDGSKRTIEQDDFIKAVGARGDPILALENEPGFGSISADGNIILQGAEPEDTRFYINGHEIPLIFHSLGFSSIFVPDVIDSVDLLTAGFGSEYGRTIGGNINLNTSDPKNDRLHGMAYVDLLNAAAVVQGPIDANKNHTFFMGGRASYIGPVFGLVTSEEDNVSFNQVPRFFDLQGNYQWKMSEQTTFDLLGLYAKDELRLRIKDFEDPFLRGDVAFRTEFFRFIPRLRHQYGEKNRFEISSAHGVDQIDQVFGNYYFDAKIYKPTLRSEWEHHFGKQLAAIVGIDSTYTIFQADLSVPAGTFPNSENDNIPFGVQEIITKRVDEKFLDLGFYTRFNISDAHSKWLFSPNVRFEYADLTNQWGVLPRLEIFRNLSDAWRIRAAVGKYSQSPQPPELEISFGNPNLQSIQSTHYALSAYFDGRNNTTDGLTADSTVFLRDNTNIVIATSDTVTQGGEEVPLRYSNEGKSFNVGSQWALRYRYGRWDTALAYTLLWSQRKEPNIAYYPSREDERHNLNLRARYRANRWEYSGRLRVISGRPATPVTGAYYDLDNDIFFPVEGAVNSDRLPFFWQLDLRVDRKWVFETWIMSLYIDIQNVTDRKNPFDYSYSFDYSERTLEGGLPILPTFGIKGEF